MVSVYQFVLVIDEKDEEFSLTVKEDELTGVLCACLILSGDLEGKRVIKSLKKEGTDIELSPSELMDASPFLIAKQVGAKENPTSKFEDFYEMDFDKFGEGLKEYIGKLDYDESEVEFIVTFDGMDLLDLYISSYRWFGIDIRNNLESIFLSSSGERVEIDA